MHTLTEICFDLNIKKGSRSRAVKCFERDYGITGIMVSMKGHSHKVLCFTHEDYITICEEYPKRNTKGGRRKGVKMKPISKTEDQREKFAPAKISKNRDYGLYQRITEYSGPYDASQWEAI